MEATDRINIKLPSIFADDHFDRCDYEWETSDYDLAVKHARELGRWRYQVRLNLWVADLGDLWGDALHYCTYTGIDAQDNAEIVGSAKSTVTSLLRQVGREVLDEYRKIAGDYETGVLVPLRMKRRGA